MAGSRGPRIVVGVTDSVGSRWALAWAVGTARRTGHPLRVVTALPAATRAEYALVTEQEHRHAAHALVTALIAEVCGGVPADVPIERLVVVDTPGRALVRAAGSVDLLVIGSTGRLTGPTRRYCARRTHCPLVVVPRPDVEDLLGSQLKPAGRSSRSRDAR
ncbi:universal stress protein [Asanoa sp. NPDC049518]|uniref:universal stress protein n=1 Tax=unclassified Asanoa TaxID=2685164 RepID=UPI0034373245